MIGRDLGAAFADVAFEPGRTAVMRDGCRLVADIYRPAGQGPWPVLLMRQPYGRDIASTVVYAHPTWWARQGFMVVVQDVRGRGDSEGDFYPFRGEESDGFDTVQWAAGLPGSNGRVGMYGFSYQASTQILAALARPPALRAIAPHMTAFDLSSGWFHREGILHLSTTVAWANQMLREDARRRGAAAAAALDDSYLAPGRLSSAFPLREARPLTDPGLPSYGRDWLAEPASSSYWTEFDLRQRASQLRLPMFHLSGWYDLYLRGSVDGYRTMASCQPDQYLLAGPWVHLPWGNLVGAADLGPEAVPRVDEAMAAWFHHWLDREAPAGLAPLRGCRYFVLGENAWRTAPTWPPPDARDETWFLASAGRANSRFGDGVLTPSAASGPDDLFNYDPEVPVVAPGGNHGGLAHFGPHDLAAQQQGLNLLVYTAPPCAAPRIIAGSARLVVHFRSSAPRTHLVARLSRVTRDGRAFFLTLGARVVEAAEGVEVTITLDPVACRISEGESLRLDLASSAFPLLIRHPNTNDDPAAVPSPAAYRRALQIVYHSPSRPSRLQLPVLPA